MLWNFRRHRLRTEPQHIYPQILDKDERDCQNKSLHLIFQKEKKVL